MIKNIKENEAEQVTKSLPKETNNKYHVKEKIQSIYSIITVEPLVALYQMAIVLSKPALDNLEFEKACRVNLKFNNTVCEAVLKGNYKNYTNENDMIQIVISNMHLWQQPMQSVTPLILALFLGSFSDRYKCRKPFFLLPILGEAIGSIGCILCVIFMRTWALEAQGILQKVIPSLFGGQIMLVMATTAYVADISSIEKRTLRLGLLQIVISVTLPLTNSFCGILFVTIGYIGVLSTSFILFTVAFLYGLFYIKENNQQSKIQEKKYLQNIFDIKHVKETFMLLVKEKGVNRTYLSLMILMTFVYRSAFDGESNVLYLYTQNVFHWTPIDYSYFLTMNGLVLLIGNIVSLPLFTKILNMSDLIILFVTISTKILTNIVFGLARTATIFYLGIITSLVTRMYRVAKKSISTKVVAKEDIGKSQSLWAICEAVAPAVSVPIYNYIYLNTFIHYPSTFFYFSIILYGICCVLVMWMYKYEIRKQEEVIVDPKTKEPNFIESLHM